VPGIFARVEAVSADIDCKTEAEHLDCFFRALTVLFHALADAIEIETVVIDTKI
jgi:hypothetical protein